MSLRDELDAPDWYFNRNQRIVAAYRRGDLIPADEVRELWEAAELLNGHDCRDFTNIDDPKLERVLTAVDALRERMERP